MKSMKVQIKFSKLLQSKYVSPILFVILTLEAESALVENSLITFSDKFTGLSPFIYQFLEQSVL